MKDYKDYNEDIDIESDSDFCPKCGGCGLEEPNKKYITEEICTLCEGCGMCSSYQIRDWKNGLKGKYSLK